MKIQKINFLSPEAPQQFVESLRDTGFAVITNHPLTREMIEEVYQDWAQFFSSPSKHEYHTPGSQVGYLPFKSENAKDSSVKDLKEFFHLFPKTPMPSGMNSSTARVKFELLKIASALLGWLDQHSGQTFSKPLVDMLDDEDTTLLRILHYPPLDGTEEPNAVRAAAHEDINLITLLPAASAPGLQVKDLEGNWVNVECDPGSIVVNAGDMLQLASKGFFKSTTHQVVNPSGDAAKKSRYSMPLFVHPYPNVQLSPEKTAGQYLQERLAEIGLKK